MSKNYFQLCNEILTELFYEKVETFEELDDLPEGIKVKQDLNSALVEICNSEDEAWKFRDVEFPLSLVEGIHEYALPDGFVDYIRYYDTPIVLTYSKEHKYLPKAYGMPLQYWFGDNKIKFYPIPDCEQNGRLLKVDMFTNCFAKDGCGVLKPCLEKEDDTTIIPDQHIDVLKWKVCADWRASLNDAKALYYNRKYIKAYANLASDQRLSADFPAGFDIMPTGYTANDAILRAFKNPRVRRIV